MTVNSILHDTQSHTLTLSDELPLFFRTNPGAAAKSTPRSTTNTARNTIPQLIQELILQPTD